MGPNQLHPVPAVRGCIESCMQALAFVDHLPAGVYAAPWGRHSAVGGHLRHCLEHFQCFLDGLDGGEVNYDARGRDRAIETSPDLFRPAMVRVIEGLEALTPASLGRPLRVRVTPARGAGIETYASTVARELAFLSSHCIHHLALVVVQAEAAGAPMPADLGVAYSTVAYRASLAAEAHG